MHRVDTLQTQLLQKNVIGILLSAHRQFEGEETFFEPILHDGSGPWTYFDFNEEQNAD